MEVLGVGFKAFALQGEALVLSCLLTVGHCAGVGFVVRLCPASPTCGPSLNIPMRGGLSLDVLWDKVN